MGGFRAVLQRYGKPAALRDGALEQVGLAMVQPLFEKDGQWRPTALGQKREDRFLFLGAPELEVDRLSGDGYVQWDGARYEVVTAQAVSLGRRVVYRWAVLRPRDEAPEEETQ